MSGQLLMNIYSYKTFVLLSICHIHLCISFVSANNSIISYRIFVCLHLVEQQRYLGILNQLEILFPTERYLGILNQLEIYFISSLRTIHKNLFHSTMNPPTRNIYTTISRNSVYICPQVNLYFMFLVNIKTYQRKKKVRNLKNIM